MRLLRPLAAALVATASLPAFALTVTPTTNNAALQAAILGGIPGLTITSFNAAGLTGPQGELSTGTYTNASGTYGIGPGVVISTGSVADYGDGANTGADHSTLFDSNAMTADDALLDPITGNDPDTLEPFPHFDVTRIDITFDAAQSVANVFFTIVFGSDEFPEFVDSEFIDGFGIIFNGANIALAQGLPINIQHPAANESITGTELDAVVAPNGNPLMVFTVPVTPGSTGNTLTFIVSDTSDPIYDTTVYISGVGSQNPVPEPSTLALLPLAVFALAAARRRSRSL